MGATVNAWLGGKAQFGLLVLVAIVAAVAGLLALRRRA